MCGIAGFLTLSSSTDDALRQRGERMSATLHHRGPDDSGVWVDAASGVALASRRLAILDLSPAGRMPMTSHCGRFVIAFNGEIYNFRDIRADLEHDGHRFVSNSDTEVLVNAWAAWGPQRTFDALNGMFSFAVWDRHERSLTVARDRLGEKPLYFARCGRSFVFGSELKALRVHPEFTASIDRRSLALLLRFGYVPAPHSIYEGVHKLQPGYFLTLRSADDDLAPQPYWNAKAVVEAGIQNTVAPNFKDATDALEELLRDSIRLRMLADVPVGAFLSGGIDSSLVVALMQAQRTAAVKTFTVGFDEESHDESHYAQAIARHLGTQHTEVRVSSAEAAEVIKSLPDIYDEPFADPSQIPTYMVSRLARASVTVSLSGDGGDELFGGYHEYVLGVQRWNILRRLVPLARSFRLQRVTVPQALGRFARATQFLELETPEAVHHYHVSGWKRPLTVVTDTVEHATVFTRPSSWIAGMTEAERMMYLDMVTYLPEDILTKLDRASMAVSLEARVPILDHRVVEFAWRLPLSFKISGRQGKRILRNIVARHVPPELFERPKMGFGFPLADWLRGPLRCWAEDLLSEASLRRDGLLNPEPIRQAWGEHLRGAKNRSTELWSILMLQAWRQRWG